MGEDIADPMIGRTYGLLERFGPSRVRNTPISEAALSAPGPALRRRG